MFHYQLSNPNLNAVYSFSLLPLIIFGLQILFSCVEVQRILCAHARSLEGTLVATHFHPRTLATSWFGPSCSTYAMTSQTMHKGIIQHAPGIELTGLGVSPVLPIVTIPVPPSWLPVCWPPVYFSQFEHWCAQCWCTMTWDWRDEELKSGPLGFKKTSQRPTTAPSGV